MKWKINYIEDGKIVRVRPWGQLYLDDKKRLSEETLAAGRRLRINSFLVDQRQTAFGFSVMDIKCMPTVLSETGFGSEDSISILLKPDSKKPGLLEFLQNVLSLTTLQIKLFTDRQKATDWLRKKPLRRANPMFDC
jgi:hypothetical protein